MDCKIRVRVWIVISVANRCLWPIKFRSICTSSGGVLSCAKRGYYVRHRDQIRFSHSGDELLSDCFV